MKYIYSHLVFAPDNFDNNWCVWCITAPIVSVVSRPNPIGLYLAHWRDRKSTRLNSSHTDISRMPSSA